jgi:hypothetical protein
MARGPSGRIIIEIEPAFKRDLHSALAADGLSLKEWFLKQGAEYLKHRKQPALPGIIYSHATEEPLLRAAEQPPDAAGAKKKSAKRTEA